ncbi:hypothetical protein Q1695_012417 [Nippostrongylus brasiliensis]|nr:hypothetical protein Q1695_012417 [Nippostrongylus brasiliensis]
MVSIAPFPTNIWSSAELSTTEENYNFAGLSLAKNSTSLAKNSAMLADVEEACGYCKSVGKRFDGHSKNTCPELFALKPCSLCGADGFDNHTLTHCPSQQKVKLELKRDHRRRVDSKQMEGLLRFNGSAATDRSDVLLFCDEYR